MGILIIPIAVVIVLIISLSINYIIGLKQGGSVIRIQVDRATIEDLMLKTNAPNEVELIKLSLATLDFLVHIKAGKELQVVEKIYDNGEIVRTNITVLTLNFDYKIKRKE